MRKGHDGGQNGGGLMATNIMPVDWLKADRSCQNLYYVPRKGVPMQHHDYAPLFNLILIHFGSTLDFKKTKLVCILLSLDLKRKKTVHFWFYGLV